MPGLVPGMHGLVPEFWHGDSRPLALMAGLDPATQGPHRATAERLGPRVKPGDEGREWIRHSAEGVDGRAKPGHDGRPSYRTISFSTSQEVR